MGWVAASTADATADCGSEYLSNSVSTADTKEAWKAAVLASATVTSETHWLAEMAENVSTCTSDAVASACSTCTPS